MDKNAKTTKLTDIYIKISPEDKTLRQFLIDLAVKNDKEGSSSDITTHDIFMLHKWKNKIGLHGVCSSRSGFELVSIEEFIRALEAPVEEYIYVGKEQVKFYDNGNIRVGCTEITTEVIDKIYERSMMKRGYTKGGWEKRN
jgi:hypothetical protein